MKFSNMARRLFTRSGALHHNWAGLGCVDLHSNALFVGHTLCSLIYSSEALRRDFTDDLLVISLAICFTLAILGRNHWGPVGSRVLPTFSALCPKDGNWRVAWLWAVLQSRHWYETRFQRSLQSGLTFSTISRSDVISSAFSFAKRALERLRFSVGVVEHCFWESNSAWVESNNSGNKELVIGKELFGLVQGVADWYVSGFISSNFWRPTKT